MTSAYYQRNREKIRSHNRAWRQQNPDRQKLYNLKAQLRSYGLTVEQYNEILTRQNGLCAICQNPNSRGRRLAVDHNHGTGEVRGLLCDRCNRLIGTLEANSAFLLQAMAYLDRKGD